jgi:16S rRNA (guanine527-N7)-methyltransferase
VRLPEIGVWSDDDPWPAGCSHFLPFQDPENVGAAIRSAAAFGVARVVLLREAAHPFHPKSARAAGPAVFQVPLLSGPAIGELTVRGAPLLALSRTGGAIDLAEWPERFGMVVGLEGPGLPTGLEVSQSLRIPISPDVESLNAAAAAAIALFAWRRATR